MHNNDPTAYPSIDGLVSFRSGIWDVLERGQAGESIVIFGGFLRFDLIFCDNFRPTFWYNVYTCYVPCFRPDQPR